MIEIRKTLLILFLTLLPAIVVSTELNCTKIKGVFEIHNGWPPALRLEDKKSKIIYGAMETSKIPSSMKRGLEQKQKASGSFCLKETGKTTKVPYTNNSIILVDIVSYKTN